MKQTKRILSLLLSLCLVLGLIPGTAFAAGGNLPFTDVDTTDWCYDAVQYVYEKGMMNGTSTTTFSPDGTTTRGMIVTILHRMEGTPAATGTAFTDVPIGQWYSDAVSWASVNGIVGGYGNGLFGPNDPITREQMAAILNRYSMRKGYDAGTVGSITGFSDASQVSSYAVEPMGWAIGNGLISGVGNNTLAPKGNATRAQVATILMRFCKNIVDKANSTPETPIDKTHTVTFDLNYGSDTRYDAKTVKEGETVSKPSNPTRSGYSFSGWYAEKSGGRQFDFKTGITSDLTLYAHWGSNSSSSGGGGGGSSGGGGGSYVPPIVTPPTPPDDTGFPFVDPEGYADYEYAMTPSVDPDPTYDSAEDYFADAAQEIVGDPFRANESENVPTEAEVKLLLESRGFTDYPITYRHSIDGEYVTEAEVSDTSNTKHPMYKTFYVSGAEDEDNQILWTIAVIDGKVFANPVSFLMGTDFDKEFLVSESEQFTSYCDGYFYVTIPNPSTVYAHQVAEISTATLDVLTFDMLCGLTGANRLESAEIDSNELSVEYLLDSIDAAYAPASIATRAATDDFSVIVSLGDSYSSGEGIEPFISQDLPWSEKVHNHDFLAHRSTKAWPRQLVVPGKSVELFFAAVSGAETRHIASDQQEKVFDSHGQSGTEWLPVQLDVFDRVNRNGVDYVTLTIGGNDVKFAKVIAKCFTESSYWEGFWGNTTDLRIMLDDLWDNVDSTMDKIEGVYTAIARKAPQATIIVAGYPKLLSSSQLSVSQEEATLVNNKVHDFNGKIAEKVLNCQQSIKIVFVDVEREFAGHEAGTRDNWLNCIIPLAKGQDLKSLFNSLGEGSSYSVHPNEKGAQAYARRVNSKIRSLEDRVKTLFGYITIADADTDMTNNLPLPGAKITLTKTGLFPTIYSAETGYDGRYSIENLPSGEYVILITGDGYIPVTGRITITDDLQNQYDAMVEAIPYGIFGGEGTASGKVIDVITGRGVAGLTLNIRKGINVTSGEIAATVETGADGNYTTPTLEAGNYSVEVIDGRTLDNEAARYLTSVFIIKVLGNHSIPNQNGSVTNGLAADQLRIVLKWGEQPRDLDSHLVGPAVGGGGFHVYYSDENYEVNSTLMANLDLDDTDSYGPETTTIYETTPGVYTYMIHDYTNRDSNSSTALSSSGAYIEVYLGASTTAAYTFYVPSGGGTLWTVFSYDSNTGTLTPINTMSYHESPSTVGSEYLPENSVAAQALIEEPLKDYEIAELQNNAEGNASQGNQPESGDTDNFEEGDMPSINQQEPSATATGNTSTESGQSVESSNVSEEGNELPGETVGDMLEKDNAVKLGT